MSEVIVHRNDKPFVMVGIEDEFGQVERHQAITLARRETKVLDDYKRKDLVAHKSALRNVLKADRDQGVEGVSFVACDPENTEARGYLPMWLVHPKDVEPGED